MKAAETIHLIVFDQDNLIETIDSNIVVVENCPETGLKHVEIPRYMHFTKIVTKIAKNSCVSCINIAGHDKIQVDVKSFKDVLQSYADARVLYEIPAPTGLEHIHMALEVDLSQLCELIRTLEQEKVEVIFIHEY